MGMATGEMDSAGRRADFDRHVKLKCHGSKDTSDAVTTPFRLTDAPKSRYHAVRKERIGRSNERCRSTLNPSAEAGH